MCEMDQYQMAFAHKMLIKAINVRIKAHIITALIRKCKEVLTQIFKTFSRRRTACQQWDSAL